MLFIVGVPLLLAGAAIAVALRERTPMNLTLVVLTIVPLMLILGAT